MPGQYKNLTPRRKEILELHLQGKTLEEMGKKFKISKERVRQILKKLNNFKQNNMLDKIYSILFYANNLNKTLDFYRSLGFSAELSEDAVRVKLDNVKMVFMDENKTEIKKESGLQPKGLGVFTYVKVDDVDEYYKSLVAKNIHMSSEPKNWPWGKREFAVKDPDGYKLIFFSEVKWSTNKPSLNTGVYQDSFCGIMDRV
jgi:uncharacterized glyoxalase superfamily protein PhnB